ncbi:hypothetical protein [Aquitalea pelogenes]|uniref:hypothetical protein n=1 Tax=Aquitalea pelogenes TaxID=1293573 RepID=UPI0035B35A8D
MQNTSPTDQITASLQLRKTIQKYLDMQSWTPVMGAMLLAGIHPPSDCEAIPTAGGTSLDGNPIIGSGNTPFYEAGMILQQWNDWCEDEDSFPSHVVPLDFINWCIEDEIQERYAVSSPFMWISIFKNVLGNNTGPLSFEVAAYTEKAIEPLQTVLSKLDEINQHLQKKNRRHSSALVRITTSTESERLVVNPHRQHLTTEEFAMALDVQPQTIYKRFSEEGHYFGVIPNKLPNRRLAWPLDAAKQVMSKSKK